MSRGSVISLELAPYNWFKNVMIIKEFVTKGRGDELEN